MRGTLESCFGGLVVSSPISQPVIFDLLIVITVYGLLFFTAPLVRIGIYKFVDYEIATPSSTFEFRDPHAVIGRFENFLIITLFSLVHTQPLQQY